jgi:anti-sigma regulatory factor (Ser/Thr protein kinase)
VISVTLPDGPHGASTARRLLAAALGDAGSPPELIDRVVLVGSELVTNAVLHGYGPPRLRLALKGGCARLSVYDGSPGLPAPRVSPEGLTAQSGRGLAIVAHIADRWGTDRDGEGKWVWAEFRPVRERRQARKASGNPPAQRQTLARLDRFFAGPPYRLAQA